MPILPIGAGLTPTHTDVSIRRSRLPFRPHRPARSRQRRPVGENAPFTQPMSCAMHPGVGQLARSPARSHGQRPRCGYSSPSLPELRRAANHLFPACCLGKNEVPRRAKRAACARWSLFLSSAFAQSRPNSSFGDFQLSTAVVHALEDSGYRTPRPIQCETIPAYLSGRDVMGLAQTGTGKTAAFAAPILHRLASEESRGTRVLILAPTRELATQIEREISVLARYTDVSTLTVFGGVPIRQQSRRLDAGPDIVVGCPGRVLDHLQRGAMDSSGIDTLVIDEADHMFDMGFQRDLKRIMAEAAEATAEPLVLGDDAASDPGSRQRAFCRTLTSSISRPLRRTNGSSTSSTPYPKRGRMLCSTVCCRRMTVRLRSCS